MKHKWKTDSIIFLFVAGLLILPASMTLAAQPIPADADAFPRRLESYNDLDLSAIWAILKNQIDQEPFNLIATLIFFLAIVHTFMTGRFMAVACKGEHAHAEVVKKAMST